MSLTVCRLLPSQFPCSLQPASLSHSSSPHSQSRGRGEGHQPHCTALLEPVPGQNLRGQQVGAGGDEGAQHGWVWD